MIQTTPRFTLTGTARAKHDEVTQIYRFHRWSATSCIWTVHQALIVEFVFRAFCRITANWLLLPSREFPELPHSSKLSPTAGSPFGDPALVCSPQSVHLLSAHSIAEWFNINGRDNCGQANRLRTAASMAMFSNSVQF
jgi:hypothetical protein